MARMAGIQLHGPFTVHCLTEFGKLVSTCSQTTAIGAGADSQATFESTARTEFCMPIILCTRGCDSSWAPWYMAQVIGLSQIGL